MFPPNKNWKYCLTRVQSGAGEAREPKPVVHWPYGRQSGNCPERLPVVTSMLPDVRHYRQMDFDFSAVARQAKSLIADADLILDLPDSPNACFP